ncbi:MAG: pseudouridine synthase [Candidatus Omnitrophota bacterium]
MRLQVFLSKAGIASRRASTEIIKSGKVSVNGEKIFEPSFKVCPEKDKISFNDNRLYCRKKIYIVLNKPKGVTTTKKDRFAEKTVVDLLPMSLRHLNPAGRLDKDTTGLILLTNDGELINKLTHPRFNVDKVYEARLDRQISGQDKTRLEKGVKLDDKYTAPCSIKPKKNNTAEITIHEGMKRQVKRMFAVLGYKVMGLKRLKEDFLDIKGLNEGEWRYLTRREIAQIGGIL